MVEKSNRGVWLRRMTKKNDLEKSLRRMSGKCWEKITRKNDSKEWVGRIVKNKDWEEQLNGKMTRQKGRKEWHERTIEEKEGKWVKEWLRKWLKRLIR